MFVNLWTIRHTFPHMYFFAYGRAVGGPTLYIDIYVYGCVAFALLWSEHLVGEGCLRGHGRAWKTTIYVAITLRSHLHTGR